MPSTEQALQLPGSFGRRVEPEGFLQLRARVGRSAEGRVRSRQAERRRCELGTDGNRRAKKLDGELRVAKLHRQLAERGLPGAVVLARRLNLAQYCQRSVAIAGRTERAHEIVARGVDVNARIDRPAQVRRGLLRTLRCEQRFSERVLHFGLAWVELQRPLELRDGGAQLIAREQPLPDTKMEYTGTRRNRLRARDPLLRFVVAAERHEPLRHPGALFGNAGIDADATIHDAKQEREGGACNSECFPPAFG